jgi:hypothetical protein
MAISPLVTDRGFTRFEGTIKKEGECLGCGLGAWSWFGAG